MNVAACCQHQKSGVGHSLSDLERKTGRYLAYCLDNLVAADVLFFIALARKLSRHQATSFQGSLSRAFMTSKRHIWLVSDGRSGSTWFASLLNHRGTFAEYFEPLHCHFSPELAGEPQIPYIRPGCDLSLYMDFYSRVFDKSFSLPRAGPTNKHRSSVLVKDIHALLLVKAVSSKLPDVDVVCLFRDPIEVAMSKLALDEWYWFREPVHLLKNEKLRQDWLVSHEEVIRAAQTQFEKYVALWAIMYNVVSRQFEDQGITYVNYNGSFSQIIDKVSIILDKAEVGAVDAPAFESAYNSRSKTERSDIRRFRPKRGEMDYAISVIESFWVIKLFG